MTPEGKVKSDVKKYLDKADAAYYMPVQNGMGCVGVPDIVACVPVEITQNMVGQTIGVFAGIETKAPGKITNTTPNQKRMLRMFAKAKGMAIVADSAATVESAVVLLRGSGVALCSIPTSVRSK
jgi:hypothetical protein